MEIILGSFFGFLAGMIIGLVPGLGTTTFLLILFPVLTDTSLLFCITFYCTLSSVSQYFGSVTTLSFGIPGENSSLPLFSIRDRLLSSNLIKETYYITSLGSFLASIFSGIVLYFTLELFNNIFYLKSYISLICAVVGLVLCVISSNNKIYTSFLLLCSGWVASKIGYDDISHTNFLTLNNPYLYSGLPALSVLMGIYAIPNIFKMTKETSKLVNIVKTTSIHYVTTHSAWVILKTIFRSSFIGFICGLVPYVGNGISSFVAFSIERKLQPRNYLLQATASEASNNAANLSVLIPLLLLGIAIVPSEFVLLEIIMSSNTFISWSTFNNNYTNIILGLFIANLIAFYISWKSIHLINILLNNFRKIIPILLFLSMTLLVWFIGFESSQGLYYTIVLIIFAFIGLLLINYDLLPFVYGFLLQNNIEQLLYRTYKIYF